MLKIRLKRIGCKSSPYYKIILSENLIKRNGRHVNKVGYYNPVNKKISLNTNVIQSALKNGAQITETLKNIIKKYLNVQI